MNEWKQVGAVDDNNNYIYCIKIPKNNMMYVLKMYITRNVLYRIENNNIYVKFINKQLAKQILDTKQIPDDI